MDCPALRSCFAVSERTPLFPLGGIEPLFDRIAGWLKREIGLELPAEWEDGWPADIEKPRPFDRDRDICLGFLLDCPDPKGLPRQFVLRLERRIREAERFQADFAVGVHPDREGMYLVSVEAGAAGKRPPGDDVLRLPPPVAGLIDDFRCTAGLEIQPHSQAIEDEGEWREMIDSDRRILPVVVASREVADRMSESMAGLAHYCHHAGGYLAGEIGGGKAHVFWPDAGAQVQAVAVGLLPALLASASLLRGFAGSANCWGELQRRKLQQRLDRTKRNARKADPNADMQSEIQELNKRVRKADEDADRFKEERDRARRELGWFLRADSTLDALKRMGNGDGVRIESVGDALAAAEQDYGGREIDFGHIDYHKEADDFDAPRHVFLALKWLARRYVAARRRGGGDLTADCKEFSGFEYVPGQSKTTMGMFQDEYRFKYRGQPVVAQEHLRWGTSRDPRQILRISFYYDDQENRVVLHYVGRHQRNQLT